MKTQLLCTFTKKSKLNDVVKNIMNTYTIVYNKIFVLENLDNLKELLCTFNIDSNYNNILENTISLHRKKETNTLYTINALNIVIGLLNDGVRDSKFPMKWENYKNCVLLTTDGDLKKINTKIYKIIDTTLDF